MPTMYNYSTKDHPQSFYASAASCVMDHPAECGLFNAGMPWDNRTVNRAWWKYYASTTTLHITCGNIKIWTSV